MRNKSRQERYVSETDYFVTKVSNQKKSTEKPGTSKARISSIKNPVESG